jgi:hypothetical protein
MAWQARQLADAIASGRGYAESPELAQARNAVATAYVPGR